MAYLLVMGALALSVCFTLGWGLVSATRWLAGRLPGAGRRPPRRASRRSPASAKATAKTRARKPAASKPPSQPWRLTRWLARRRFARPLTLLTVPLYALTRLVEYGMTLRPQSVPVAYHDLVTALGWVAAGLLSLALINLLASWRCRGSA
jgi:hypothetical protein